MGYIKEPDGIDFVVDPTPLTAADRKMISEIIAYYKATGRKISLKKLAERQRGQKNTTHNISLREMAGRVRKESACPQDSANK